jgi:hypothetical protein
MKRKYATLCSLPCLIFLCWATACTEEGTINKKIKRLFSYLEFSKSVRKSAASTRSDSTNLFDKNEFNPFTDSIGDLLQNIEMQLRLDSAEVHRLGLQDSLLFATEEDSIPAEADSIAVLRDTFTNDIRKIQSEEILALKYNLKQISKIDSNKSPNRVSNCKQKECKVWAKISKRKQLLFLYVEGALVDSFKVSTGDTKHETPTFDVRPSGPIFKKYTSKKFPGGNYQGLGNMPYAVFISGGFAIHGTTTGNIARLGKKASHGCIRLHPDNGKLFSELIREVGLENTWITILE